MNDSSAVLASRFRKECEIDGVGIWQIVKAVADNGTPEQIATRTASIARAVLADGHVRLGQFDGQRFVPWAGVIDDQLSRLADEILQRDAHVDIGDIGWLVIPSPSVDEARAG